MEKESTLPYCSFQTELYTENTANQAENDILADVNRVNQVAIKRTLGELYNSPIKLIPNAILLLIHPLLQQITHLVCSLLSTAYQEVR